MEELSLYILDIAQNSLRASSALTEITLTETDETVTVSVKDDGCGICEEKLNEVFNPFYTTRTTGKVGLGIPLFRLAAEQTGGSVWIESSQKKEDHGTRINGVFYKSHIDFPPLGDMASTVCLLALGCGDGEIVFSHTVNGKEAVNLDTRMLRAALEGLPLSNPEVQLWIKGYINQQYENIKM